MRACVYIYVMYIYIYIYIYVYITSYKCFQELLCFQMDGYLGNIMQRHHHYFYYPDRDHYVEFR